MIVLRDYQSKGIDQLRQKIKEGKKKIIFWCATAAGKGVIMSQIAYNSLQKGNKILTVMYGQELVRQTEKNYIKHHSMSPTIYMGAEKELSENTIASISTLEKNIPAYPFRTIIVDEAHGTNSSSYQKLFDAYTDAIFIGMTATPFLRAGRPLAKWEDYVYPITTKELRTQGYLCDVRIFSPTKINTENCTIENGEYKTSDLFSMAMPIIGDVITDYQEFGEDRTAILFAVNQAHAKIMAEQFNNVGISAIVLDSESLPEERRAAIEELAQGSVRIICSVNILNQGIDIPSIGCIIMARPTLSEVVYVQQLGRGLRPSPGKTDLILLDNADNCARHGLPYDDRFPAIANIPLQVIRREVVHTCKECYAVFKGDTCPQCSTEIEVKGRVVETIPGTLQETKCKKCGSRETVIKKKGPHTGLYCALCNLHIKWIPKDIGVQAYANKMKAVGQKMGRKPNWYFYMTWKKFGKKSIGEIQYPEWFLKSMAR